MAIETLRRRSELVKAYAAWLGVPLWLRSIDILQKSDDNVERRGVRKCHCVTRVFGPTKRWVVSDGIVLLGAMTPSRTCSRHNRDDTFENDVFANINRSQH